MRNCYRNHPFLLEGHENCHNPPSLLDARLIFSLIHSASFPFVRSDLASTGPKRPTRRLIRILRRRSPHGHRRTRGGFSATRTLIPKRDKQSDLHHPAARVADTLRAYQSRTLRPLEDMDVRNWIRNRRRGERRRRSTLPSSHPEV